MQLWCLKQTLPRKLNDCLKQIGFNLLFLSASICTISEKGVMLVFLHGLDVLKSPIITGCPEAMLSWQQCLSGRPMPHPLPLPSA